MKALYLTILITLFGSVGTVGLFGQSTNDSLSTDSVVTKVKHGFIFKGKPGKAMLMSLIIPGTGQIYNKSYIRVPFVWAAVGGMGYVLYYNTNQYNCLKDAYIANVDGVPYIPPDNCPPELEFITDGARLKALRDEANKNRQLSIVGFTLVWLANGIDAFVDAHLKEFDINEDLSFKIRSNFDNDPNAPMRMGLYVQF